MTSSNKSVVSVRLLLLVFKWSYNTINALMDSTEILLARRLRECAFEIKSIQTKITDYYT